ncbi:MAG: hypothetical protein WCO66_01855 [Candidatus Absconditabacteria bacterium]
MKIPKEKTDEGTVRNVPQEPITGVDFSLLGDGSAQKSKPTTKTPQISNFKKDGGDSL